MKEDEARKFLEMVFGSQPEETDPVVLRNPGCKFTEKVLNYLYSEWEIELTDYSHDVQNRAIDMVDMMKERGENPSNTAGRISMEVVPI
jgi:hypothetical protein